MNNAPNIAETVHFAAAAAAEAYRVIINGDGNHAAADAAARTAFKCCMPIIDSRQSVQAYLATIVRGLELHLLTVRESQQYIKAARLWITADERKQAAS
jgi:hypothetical protein